LANKQRLGEFVGKFFRRTQDFAGLILGQKKDFLRAIFSCTNSLANNYMLCIFWSWIFLKVQQKLVFLKLLLFVFFLRRIGIYLLRFFSILMGFQTTSLKFSTNWTPSDPARIVF
jgi:hypothetical protein